MRRACFLTIFLFTIPLFADEYNEIIKEADKIFFSYHEDLSRLIKSVEIYKKAIGKNPKDPYPMIMISRAFLTYADLVPEDEKERERIYEEGMKWAERAIKVDEKYAMGHFWFFANLARIQQLKGTLYSLATLSTLKKHIKRAYELKPDDAMILDGLGAFYCELPSFLGGDLKKSEEILRRAIEADPTYTLSYYDLAVNLYKQKRYEEALKTAEMVLSITNPTYYADWFTWDRIKALELIEKIKKK